MPTITLGGRSVDWNHVARYAGINDNVDNPNGVQTFTQTRTKNDCLRWCYN